MSPATRQPARRSFRLVVGLAFAILAVLLVVTGWELRREFASAGALRAEVERSYDTRLQIQSVFALMQDAETMMIADFPIIPIYFYTSRHMLSTAVGGWEDNAQDQHPTRFVSITR